MSGGADAQAGFVYQQDYAAFRILSSEAKRLLTPKHTATCVAAFKVEGRETEAGPSWDVAWTLENEVVHLRECKDTAITPNDRKTFYLRVRREIANGADPSKLEIGWVTDPGKQQGNILRHLVKMTQVAFRADVSGDNLPDRVDSSERALCEAIYYLSSDESSENPAVSEEVSRELLSRLTVDRFRAEELAASVEWLAPTVFPAGAGEAIRELIQGNFSVHIQRHRTLEYTREQFLAEVQTAKLTLDLVESLRDILTFHSAATMTVNPSGITWSCRPSRPSKVWPLSDRLNEWDDQRSCVIVAGTGVGKTTSSQQMFAEQALRLNKHHVLRIEASNADADLIKLLPRLCCMLCGVSSTWLALDGLDQIVPAMQQTWRQALSRLLTLPNLTLVITARREVVAAHDWMQELLSTLPEISLEELSENQVYSEFRDVGLSPPRNQSLIDCLKNAFLFSIYARTVTDEDMPLTDRGEVTAFDVIAVYWSRRVNSESQGFRVAGDSAMSSASAKRAAVAYLANETLAGKVVFQRSIGNVNISNGIETLVREGVLIDHSTSTVIWSHAWIREFATIDSLVGRLENPSATAVAQAICAVSVDHAARTAAIGGCKWIVSHTDLGRIEEYLSCLYESNTGLARKALTLLLEDSPRYLQLGALPPRLLIEALYLAREMKMRQWLEQVASLPDSLFTGVEGSELQIAAFRYESEVTYDG